MRQQASQGPQGGAGIREKQNCDWELQAKLHGGETDVIDIHETASGISFAVKVHPRAKKNAITGEVGSALKVALTAPPIDGRANEACIEFFANLLEVPRSSVTMAAGQSSRKKILKIAGVSAAQVKARLHP